MSPHTLDLRPMGFAFIFCQYRVQVIDTLAVARQNCRNSPLTAAQRLVDSEAYVRQPNCHIAPRDVGKHRHAGDALHGGKSSRSLRNTQGCAFSAHLSS